MSQNDGIPLFASLGNTVSPKGMPSKSKTSRGLNHDGIPLFASIGSNEGRTIRKETRAVESEDESESSDASSSGYDSFSE